MKVPPAATYRSRIANEVASSVDVPKRIAPRLSTLTSRRAFKSVPIVRYFMWVPLQPPGPARTLSTSLDAGARSRSNHPPDGHAPALARGAVPLAHGTLCHMGVPRRGTGGPAYQPGAMTNARPRGQAGYRKSASSRSRADLE